jgi:hypothetical protein
VARKLAGVGDDCAAKVMAVAAQNANTRQAVFTELSLSIESPLAASRHAEANVNGASKLRDYRAAELGRQGETSFAPQRAIVIPTAASHSRRDWEAEWRDLLFLQ